MKVNEQTLYTKSFWKEVYTQYTGHEDNFIKFYLCKCPSFAPFYSNKEIRLIIIDLAIEYLKTNENNCSLYYTIESKNLTSDLPLFNRIKSYQETLKYYNNSPLQTIRIGFLKYCINKFK